jgi:hypothetical protein
MAEGDSLSFHHVPAHRCRVQQEVHYVVVQKVHLIHVQEAAIGASQDARLELLPARLQSNLDVESADDPILRSADRQVNKAGAVLPNRQVLTLGHPLAAIVAQSTGAVRIAVKGAIGYDLYLWQQGS